MYLRFLILLERLECNMTAPNLPEKFDYKIHVGPSHPTHKEPIRFTFYLRGEHIEKVDLRIGHNHRGIEKALEARTFVQNLLLVARLSGMASNAHQFAYVQNIEKCADLYHEVPERAHWLRVIASELERIQSHMLWYGQLAHDAGFNTLWHTVWRDREIVMDMLEKWTGNRVNYAICSFGGVRRDLSEELRSEFVESIKKLRNYVESHKKIAESEKTYYVRLRGVAVLSRDDALRYCAVGPTARASGVSTDIRFDDPYAVYGELKKASFDRVVYNNGDVLDTNRVRLDETLVSCDMVLYCLENLPTGEYRMNEEFPRELAPNESIQRIEAQRGEEIHYVRSNGTDKPDRYKISTPTFANLPALKHRLLGCKAADIPVAIRSIDPCIACAERVIIVDAKSSKKTVGNKDLRLKNTMTRISCNR